VIALRATKSFLSADDTIRKVIFVCYDDENYTIYRSLSD
jgi:O-acetyl-ADP-ribose deacetylase (regulator of RNase III)